MMQNYRTLIVYCPNIACGTQEARGEDGQHQKATSEPRILSAHRRLEFRGSKKPGFFTPYTKYHFYECPVCGREVAYAERQGVIERVSHEATYAKTEAAKEHVSSDLETSWLKRLLSFLKYKKKSGT